MPASEVPRESYLSVVDETEGGPGEVESEIQVHTEEEIAAEELREGTAPGKE